MIYDTYIYIILYTVKIGKGSDLSDTRSVCVSLSVSPSICLTLSRFLSLKANASESNDIIKPVR